jgi:hypothetical protein
MSCEGYSDGSVTKRMGAMARLCKQQRLEMRLWRVGSKSSRKQMFGQLFRAQLGKAHCAWRGVHRGFVRRSTDPALAQLRPWRDPQERLLGHEPRPINVID